MSAYFATLSQVLKQAGIFQPCLLLDRDRLDSNIALVKARLDPGLAVRLVDKSLACLPLLSHIGKALGTDRFMTFHPPISEAVLKAFPDADLLYGKPMPVSAARAAMAKGAAGWSIPSRGWRNMALSQPNSASTCASPWKSMSVCIAAGSPNRRPCRRR
jgi:D-serine deaminase-like pyridoxal phosphate-dependent protein